MLSAVEMGKRRAAVLAVDKYIQNHQKIGIGSGSTIVYAVERLAERVTSEGLHVQCVPTSFQARRLIQDARLPLTDLGTCVDLDVCIDGADEVDAERNCIKGGGGCLTQEKIVASAARRFVVVADVSKKSCRLGDSWRRGVPIEVIPMAHELVSRRIEQRFGGSVHLRMAVSKMGPVVTDNGNFIIDWKFDTAGDHGDGAGKSRDWARLAVDLKMMPGVVETGLFVGMVQHVIFGGAGGTEELNHG